VNEQPASGPEPRRVVQRGLWFEEMELGTVYEHRPGRTVTEADNVLFTTLTMNTQPLHLDQAASEQLPPFHDRLVNSMFTLSTLIGLSVGQLTQGTLVANLGFGEVTFPAPVRHGDTLYAYSEVIETRDSNRPDAGEVLFRHLGRNQDGKTVFEGERRVLIKRRSHWGGR